MIIVVIGGIGAVAILLGAATVLGLRQTPDGLQASRSGSGAHDSLRLVYMGWSKGRPGGAPNAGQPAASAPASSVKTATANRPQVLAAATTVSGPATGAGSTTPTAPMTSTGDDYPAKWALAPKDSIIDTWGMDNRESVSYTAWKVSETFGDMPTNWPALSGCMVNKVHDNSTDAICWPADAKASGIAGGTTPKVHAVGIRTFGVPTGFSAWIESDQRQYGDLLRL